MTTERRSTRSDATTGGDRPVSYDYARRTGLRRLSWDDLARLSETLAERLAARGIDRIVGVATGGLIPATLVSCALRRELTPIRLSRREDHRVVSSTPVWKVPLTLDLGGQRVAIVDDVADTGETLALVSSSAGQCGAASVSTACLVAHSWARPAPDVAGLLTDELVVFPWHERVVADGQWGLDPELSEAIAALGVDRQGSSQGERNPRAPRARRLK